MKAFDQSLTDQIDANDDNNSWFSAPAPPYSVQHVTDDAEYPWDVVDENGEVMDCFPTEAQAVRDAASRNEWDRQEEAEQAREEEEADREEAIEEEKADLRYAIEGALESLGLAALRKLAKQLNVS